MVRWMAWATVLVWMLMVLAGCAGERAALEVAKQTGAIATAVIEKAQITQSMLNAEGEVRDPEYVVEAYWTVKTGLDMKIQLNGVNLKGQAQGSGSGADAPLSEGAREAIRARLADKAWYDSMPGELIAILRAKLKVADDAAAKAAATGTTP